MVWRLTLFHAGSCQQRTHAIVGEAQPAMRKPAQQIVAAMFREVDDDQPPTRPQHARHLCQNALRLLGVVQYHLHYSDIERTLGQRQAGHIREPHRTSA